MNDFSAGTERMIEVNRANWDERAPIHARSSFYGQDPEVWFADFEWTDLGPLGGRDVLHLQCHIGTESVVLARRGARVVGVDISGVSLAEAREVVARHGVSVEFVESNVYGCAASLGGRTFDVVYTGKGALCYLPDLDRWAAEAVSLLRPGGMLYVVEFHPLLYSLGLLPPPDGGEELLLRNDFLAGRGAVERDATRTYTDGPALTEATVAYEWTHDLGEVVTALVDAGLSVERLRETDRLPWPRWSTMIPAAGGWFRLPAASPRIPVMYALLARKRNDAELGHENKVSPQ